MKKTLSKAIGIALVFVPGIALAAYNDVTLTSSAVLSVGGATVNVSGSSNTVETITVSANTFDITVQAGSRLTVTAPDVAVTAMTVSQSTSNSCSGGIRTLTINASSASTITIRPSTTACTTASSGSSGGGGTVSGLIGGGGGGGGGASAPASTPVTTPTPAPTIRTTPVTTFSLSLTSDFGIGAAGNDVVALQNFLESKGFLAVPAGTTKGTFGGLTKKALQAYQTHVGISATGYVGPKTRAAINGLGSVSAPTAPAASTPPTSSGSFMRDLEVGVIGSDVRQLQVFLNTHGFVITKSGGGSPGLETSKFGGLTKAALAKFQVAHGIVPASGYFGPKTRAVMNGMSGQ